MTAQTFGYHQRIKAVLTFAILQFFALTHLCAQTIDFETLPNGSPLDGGTVISTQFAAAPYGVSFRFQDGTYPVIRKVGGNNNGKPTAFWGYPDQTGYNTPAPGQNVGTNFLSDDGSVDAPPAPLIVTYGTAVASASGFILDIDALEAWDVYARDAQSNVLASVHLEHGQPGTGDGIATPFSFNRPTADIKSLRIVFTGAGNNVGLAFDSFSPSSLPVTPVPAGLRLSVLSNQVSMIVAGTPQAVYAIEALGKLSNTNTNWVPVTSVILPASPFMLTNFETVTTTQRFYRAVGLQ